MTNRKFATTLARGLSVLQAFRSSDSGLSHSDLVKRTDLAPATLTRLTYTLCELGFLTHVAGQFRLGAAALALGSVANNSLSFLDLVRDDMQALADETGTLVALGLREGQSIVMTKTWRPEGVASIWFHPGNRVPIIGSSSGLALLASITEHRLKALEPNERIQQMRRIGNDQLIARGFTIIPEQYRELAEINAVAVPFLSPEFDEPIIFLCGGMRDDLSQRRMEREVGPPLRDLVARLESQTGSLTRMKAAMKGEN